MGPHVRRRSGTLLFVLGSCLLSTVLLEGLLRLCLFTELVPSAASARLRNPLLFAEPDQDDFWKLRWRWTHPTLGALYHSQLGTAFPRTPGNPLGASGRPRPIPLRGAPGRVALFFGASYLTSPLFPLADRLPQLLEARLPATQVWNFGMWSHGLDQVALRFEMTYEHFSKPTVLVGITTDDIDRCVLSVREGQKPRFVIGPDGGLQLTNVPVDPDQTAYMRRNPPEVRSFVLRMIRVGLGRTSLARWWPFLRPDHRDAEKRALAAALLERMVETSRAHGIPIAFVIFYPDFELGHPTWRAGFLRDTFAHLEVPYVDTEAPLRRALTAGTGFDDIYDPSTRHPTRRANEVVVDAILDAWPDLLVPEEGEREDMGRAGVEPATR